jgi:uncharacterized damage-inducible protein DinB
MKASNPLCLAFMKDLEAEAPSSRKCIERVPESLYGWKPHEKSMTLGYLCLLVAEIPKWISAMLEESEIDFGKFVHYKAATTADTVRHFDENVAHARSVLQGTPDAELSEPFSLKNNGKVLMSMPKGENIGPTIRHLVHHRGQLTVFMRLNNIAVPAIYGPSADERGF